VGSADPKARDHLAVMALERAKAYVSKKESLHVQTFVAQGNPTAAPRVREVYPGGPFHPSPKEAKPAVQGQAPVERSGPWFMLPPDCLGNFLNYRRIWNPKF
jgi:hypothetical protein